MSEMVERVAKALKANLAEQFNAKPTGFSVDDWTAIGGTIYLEALARAAIEAMLEWEPFPGQVILLPKGLDIPSAQPMDWYRVSINSALGEEE